MNIYEYMSVGEDEKPLDRIVTDGGFCSIFRTIGCIGDSLSSGEFESTKSDGTRLYHDFYDYSWGQFIGRSSSCQVFNFSRGGMTAGYYMDDWLVNGSSADIDKKNPCQAYIIALGVNDLAFGDEVGSVADIDKENPENNTKNFAGYYGKIIQRLKTIQPRAKIFLVSIPRRTKEGEEFKRKHRDFLRDLTKLFKNTYLIDLFEYAPVEDEEFMRKYWLGHMNPMGYLLAARIIESYIDYIIRKNPEDFAQVGFIGTDLYFKPEE